ncbi:hypothetical protein ACO0RG_000689 [Hanseniaspora osmophila]
MAKLSSKLRTTGLGIGNGHRRISIGFLKPDKKNPLVKKYAVQNKRKRQRRGDEQRSVRSLVEDFGSSFRVSVYDEDEGDVIDYQDDQLEGDEGFGGQLSRSVSLPSRVSEESEVVGEPDVGWLLQEHERRYSQVPTIPEHDDEADNIEQDPRFYLQEEIHGHEVETTSTYDSFMRKLKMQSKSHLEEGGFPRRGSYGAISGRGEVPKIFEAEDDDEDFEHENVTFASESKILVRCSIPLIFTFLLEQIFSVVCSLVVGHLGKAELAAVSLASMTTNITLAVFEGISTSLDTLCPNAYGAGNYKGVGVHLQRCVALSMIVFIPFAFMWWYSEHLLLYVIPESEKELVVLTSKFLRVVILGAPPYILFENLKRFLQAQGIFDAAVYILLFCCPINILLSYLLVWNETIGMGFIGAPIAVVLNFWLMAIMLVLYTVFVDGRKCWGGFSKKALTHWKDLAKLAIPGVIMLEAEDLSYELLTLFSSYFGTEYLAAQSAIATTALLMYMVAFAVGVCSSTRIANFIGAKRVDNAHIASQVGICASLFVGLLNCGILNFGKNYIASIYTSDPQVFHLITDALPLVGFVEIWDAVNCIGGACLRGQGMQYIGSIVNLTVYYLLAIPLGMFLAWVLDMKIKGLWTGIGLGMFLIGAIESYYVLYPNWEDILERFEMMKETEDDSDDEEDDLAISDSDSDLEEDENTRLFL